MLVGHPLGFQGTASTAIVSAIRRLGGLRWFQTDTAGNFGNSGGPIMNEFGDVVGILMIPESQTVVRPDPCAFTPARIKHGRIREAFDGKPQPTTNLSTEVWVQAQRLVPCRPYDCVSPCSSPILLIAEPAAGTVLASASRTRRLGTPIHTRLWTPAKQRRDEVNRVDFLLVGLVRRRRGHRVSRPAEPRGQSNDADAGPAERGGCFEACYADDYTVARASESRGRSTGKGA